MRDDVREMQERMKKAQDVMITNGPLMQVLEGRLGVTDALRDVVRGAGDGLRGEVKDTSGYDPVLRHHTRT